MSTINEVMIEVQYGRRLEERYNTPVWRFLHRRRVFVRTVFWGIILPPIVMILVIAIDPSIVGLDNRKEMCGDQVCTSTTIASPTLATNDPNYSSFQNLYNKLPSTPRLIVIIILITFLATLAYRFLNCMCETYSPPAICSCSFACCPRRQPSERDSAGSLYPPPRYSQCGSFLTAPPPYSEVTSKPGLYPLVITCGEGDGKCSGNYLMVHYFRDYLIRAPGSLSATSTQESINSGYLCNATNEENTTIPPSYSCEGKYDGMSCERGRPLLRSLSSLTETAIPRLPIGSRSDPNTFRENLITSPVQPLDRSYDLELELIDCEMYCDGGCKPRLGSSPPTHRSPTDTDKCVYEQEAYGLRHMYSSLEACESPPQPTSPTQTSTNSTMRKTNVEKKRSVSTKVKKAMYMPLSAAFAARTSRVPPGVRASSRSAPATPCGAIVPTLLSFSQRASRHSVHSSKLKEEKNPLLTDDSEYGRTDDDKF